MKNIIDDATIEYVGILAKLSLSEEEAEQAKTDKGKMLDYNDKLGECRAHVACLQGAERIP